MVIFLYGEDTFRSQKKLRQLKNKFKKEIDATSSSLVVIEGKEADLAYIRKVVLAPGLFVKKRFVIFKDFLKTSPAKELQDDVISLLREYAGQNDNIIVFWESSGRGELRKVAEKLFRFLQKQEFSQEFKFLSESDLKKWVVKDLAKQQSNIEGKALEILLEFIGNDMWRLYNELEKLKAYKPQQTINMADVKLLVSGSIQENIYYLLDLIIRRDRSGALLFLEKILHTESSAENLLNLLKWQANTLSLIKGSLADGLTSYTAIAKRTGLHQFVVKKNMVYVKRMSTMELIKLLEKTSELELAFRKQKTPVKVLLTNYLLQLIE